MRGKRAGDAKDSMGRTRGLATALLMAVISAAPAVAAPAAPAMTFTRVRDGVACEPDCPEWIAAQGEIKPGTARVFQSFLARLDGRRRPIVINSGGGSVEDALDMGRLIRARGLAVAVGRTMIFTPPPAYNLLPPAEPWFQRGYASSYPAICLSACTLVLAGGVERYASDLAIVGVHEVKRRQTRIFVLRKYLVHYRIIDGRKIETSRQIISESKNAVTSTDVDPAAVDARIVAYFKQMGEDRRLLDLMRTASPEQIHMMTPDEEKDTRLVTIRLSAPAVMATKPPENGLDGAPVDPASGARATVGAALMTTIATADASKALTFYVHFALRRGGAGVVATFTLNDPSHASLRYGATLGGDVRRLPTPDKNTGKLFLPNASFCRLAHDGDIFVIRADASPTQAPGLPDPRAPLFRASVLGMNGISEILQEICPRPPARARQTSLKRAYGRRTLK